MRKHGVGVPLALCAVAGTSSAGVATSKAANQAAAVLDSVTNIASSLLVHLQ
jgi:hypothetical protein